MWVLDQGLLTERSGLKEDSKRWDIPLVILMARVGPTAILVVAGLDLRYGWSPPVALWLQIAMLAVTGLVYALNLWAMASNRFFSALVRIQADRGHTVATEGTCRCVRHPGYLGAILHNLASALTLGSLWALMPAGFTILVTVIRTALEDKTL